MWLAGLIFALVAGSAFGQTQPRPSFEVASVRPATDAKDPTFSGGIQIKGDSVIARRVNLATLIRAAYGLRARFRSGPDWLESEPVFDIRAKIPAGASPRQVPEMFQSLLDDRFKLKFHIEHRERTVYGLVAANGGPKLQPSTSVDESLPGGALSGIASFGPAGGSVWTSPNGSSYRVRILPDSGGELTLIGVSMDEFAYHLNDLEGAAIIDRTELRGLYDLTFTISREEMCDNCPAASKDHRPSTTLSEKESLRRLGLRLEKQRAKVDVFIIDQLEKSPTEN
jgi:uncharacterized protein (TIGR03435 family)